MWDRLAPASMDIPINELKRALREGRPQVGLWSSLSSHITVEVVAGAGFDWLLLDTEHSPNELTMVHGQFAGDGGRHRVARRAARVERSVVIKRFLDIGVQNFLVPWCRMSRKRGAAVAIDPLSARRAFAASPRRFGPTGMAASRITSARHGESASSCKSRRGPRWASSKRSPRSTASTACSSGRAISPPTSGTLATARTLMSVPRSTMPSRGSRRQESSPASSRRSKRTRATGWRSGCLFIAVGSDVGFLRAAERSPCGEVQPSQA